MKSSAFIDEALRNISSWATEAAVMESCAVAYLTDFLSNSWRKSWNSREKQLASRLVQTPSSPRSPLFPRKRRNPLLVVLYVPLGNQGRIVRLPRGDAGTQYQLCQPEHLPLEDLVLFLDRVFCLCWAMYLCWVWSVCWGQIHRTRAWAKAAGISTAVIGFTLQRVVSEGGKARNSFWSSPWSKP